MFRLFYLILLIVLISPTTTLAFPKGDTGLVILNYHRVGEDQHPQTNIRSEQFENHIRELKNGDYNLIPLPQALKVLKSGESLPPRSIAITFDGGYTSSFQNALPLLDAAKIPYTYFIAPSSLSEDSSEHIDWEDVRFLQKNPMATIGLHPAHYARIHLDGADTIKQSINSALGQTRKNLDKQPKLFAYPFGEYNEDYYNILKEYDFSAALTQHAGPAHGKSNLMALPRFIFTENYADIERFRMVANALPLAVKDIEPTPPILSSQLPTIGFTLPEEVKHKKDILTCYLSGMGKVGPTFITETRIQITADLEKLSDRARLNCTLPDHVNDDGEIVWRWFGYLMSVED